MSERVFNLFLICKDLNITEIGVASHEASGSDREKMAFLQARVETDLLTAKRYPVPERYRVVFSSGAELPRALPYQEFQRMANDGQPLDVFEEVLEQLAAPPEPITCITPVIDGKLINDFTALIPQPPDPSVQAVVNQQASTALSEWSQSPDSADQPLMIVDLGLGETNEAILDRMRQMKTARQTDECARIVCSIRGFGADPRELEEIPEVRAFCRRLVSLGFISYLDFTTLLDPKDRHLIHWWGAAEVWLCGEGRLEKWNRMNQSVLEELQHVMMESNERADAALGPMD